MTYFYKKPEYIIGLSRELRKWQTESEILLWDKIKNRQIDWLKFLRQKPVFAFKDSNWSNRFYIADFYCYSIKLIIELDGLIHDEKERKEYDIIRDEIIKNYNYTILRFTNHQIKTDIENIINEIKSFVPKLNP